MNERKIFAETLQKPTEAERSAYLDEVCGKDTTTRERVEALLKEQSSLGSFMEHPPVEGALSEFCTDASKFAESLLQSSQAGVELDDVSLDFLEPSDERDSLGRLAQYEITEVVGRGGMGIVLKSHDTKLDRVVAIKVLAPELAANPTAHKRFLREAQAAAAVSHDHVVTIYAVEEDRLPYLVMEFIDGQSLQEKIDRDGQLDLIGILRIGSQIAAGLSAAHEQGLIHRDIKPSNILLQNGIERVQITDFGLARTVDDVNITRPGEIAGTPQYMSPEQAEGKAVDCRSDLFSLGSVLYCMCSGRSPFRAETTIGSIRRVCDDTHRPVREVNPEIPDWLAEIIDRLLIKNPDERLQTAGEVANLLGKHLAHIQDRGSMPFPGALPRVIRSEHTSPRRRWLIAATLLLAIAASLGMTEATGVTQITSTLIRILTPDGTLIVEVDGPGVRVTIEGDGGLLITGAGPQEVRLRPGKYQVRATKGGKPIREELVTITRGGRQVVKVTLEGTQRGAERAALRAAVEDETLLDFLTTRGVKIVLDFFDMGGVSLDFSTTQITGAELKQLKDLPKLRNLTLNDRQVTHVGLDHVKDLTSLKSLNLSNARITDAGLEQLQGMTWLWGLNLSGTQITDAGLEHLKGMSNLRDLSLGETRITDSGLEHLKGMTSLDNLKLHYTQITDVGLEHLQGLTHLRFLMLNGTQITDVAVAHLNRLATLERLTIWHLTNAKLAHLKSLIHVESLNIPGDLVTDAGLMHLAKLTNLQELDLTDTRVTAEGVKKLKQALPDCEIRAEKLTWEGERDAAAEQETEVTEYDQ